MKRKPCLQHSVMYRRAAYVVSGPARHIGCAGGIDQLRQIDIRLKTAKGRGGGDALAGVVAAAWPPVIA